MSKLLKGDRYIELILLATILGICAGQMAPAQLPTATIAGVVKDSSGAVIPGVTVTATNSDTGQSRSSQTSNSGSYRFPALQVGTYDVRAEHPGFQAKVQQGLRIAVGDEALLNFTLEVGAVTETVSVTAEAPIVNTTSGTLGSLVNSETMTDLPLNGRNWNDLTLLQVGVNEYRASDTAGTLNGTQFSANGAPVRSNLFTIDGTIMNDSHGTGGASGNENTLGVEAIREYKVATNAFSAEYGMTMGSQVSLVTKSGTNEVHGSIFEYLRNSALDARDWDDIPNKPPFRRNNFGGSVGGPVIHDKAFYFVTYEALRQAIGNTTFATVPLPAARVDGPLAQSLITAANLRDANGNLITTISPSVKPYLQYWPSPNNLDTATEVAAGIGRYFYSTSRDQSENYGQGRADYALSGADSLFGRYTITDSNDARTALIPEVSSNFPTRNQYLTLSDNHIFSPALLGTFRASFSRTHTTANYNSELPLNLAFNPGYQMGGLGISGVNDYTSASGTTPVELNQRIFSYSGDFFYTLGGHSLKFGMLTNRYRQLLYNDGGNSPRGGWSFDSLGTFLAARPTQFSTRTPGSITDRTFEYKTWGFYLQDDFRLKPTFTLNLGLRYEFQTAVDEIRGKGAAVRDIVRDSKATESNPIFVNPSLKNFSPRVGFAWDVFGTGKTSVRGGGALLYDIGAYGTSLFIHASGTPPLSSVTTIAENNTLGPGNTPIPVPTFGPYPTIPTNVGVQRLRTIDYHLQQPRLLSYNFTVEQQLPWQIGLTAAYAGSRGMHLVQNQEGNPIYAGGTQQNGLCVDVKPNQPDVDVIGPKCWLGVGVAAALREVRRNTAWADVDMRLAEGDSWYNSLQFTVQKRLGRGLQFQSSYTWAHALDDSQGQLGVEGGNNAGDVTNRRYDKSSANFDLRHSWSFNAIYRLPSRFEGALGTIANGWWLSGILTWRSGDPFNLAGNSTTRRRGAISNRPNLKPGVDLNDVTRGGSIGCTLDPPGTGPNIVIAPGTPVGTKEMFMDPCAFDVPPLGYMGNVGRNAIYGPNFSNLNFSVVKNTPLRMLGESGSLEFRAEFFNLFNMVSWSNPSGTLFSPAGSQNTANTFTAAPIGSSFPGQITSTATKPRQIQFALKLLF
ncbi:MAG: TonB-dependent receptor [Acidobacteria bacterium]|nr:TonB-dependent receptor [Acidobacteriota bacterium]